MIRRCWWWCLERSWRMRKALPGQLPPGAATLMGSDGVSRQEWRGGWCCCRWWGFRSLLVLCFKIRCPFPKSGYDMLQCPPSLLIQLQIEKRSSSQEEATAAEGIAELMIMMIMMMLAKIMMMVMMERAAAAWGDCWAGRRRPLLTLLLPPTAELAAFTSELCILFCCW